MQRGSGASVRERLRMAAIEGLPTSMDWTESDFPEFNPRRFRLLAESYGLDQSAS